MTLPELSQLSIPSRPLPAARWPHKRRYIGRFLKGPVPLSWLEAAAQLPGRAFHVGVLLWFRAGLTRSMSVKLSGKHARLFAIDRFTKARALHQLERARLVSVQRARGLSPVITILLVGDD